MTDTIEQPGWGVYLPDEGEGFLHVMPIKDLMTHRTNGGCWCHPINLDGVTVHSSIDRREEDE